MHLSDREREILALLPPGYPQDDIATKLFISPKTVATHIQHVPLKLNVRSRAQAVAAAYRLGISVPDDDAHANLRLALLNGLACIAASP